MQYPQNLSSFVLQYEGRSYPLTKTQTVIGSDQECDICVENNSQVFPKHALLTLDNGQVRLQRAKGAFVQVNGSPVDMQILQDQDEIMLGNSSTIMTLQDNGSPTGGRLRAAPTDDPLSTGAQVAYKAGLLQNQQLMATGKTPLIKPAFASPLPPGTSDASIAVPPQNAYTPSPQPQDAHMSYVPPQDSYLPPQRGYAPQQPQDAYNMAMPQQQAPRSTGESLATDTTRYLCAAGHLDETFQDYVMRNIIYEERRALGESYGVDMGAVVSWCQSGIRRINTRDVLLTILLAFVILGYLLTIFASIAAFSAAGASQSFNPFSTLQIVLLLLRGVGMLLLGIIILPIALNVEKWIRLRWPKLLVGLITYPILFVFTGILAVPLAWLIIFVELLIRFYGEPTKRLRKDTFNPHIRPVELDQNLEAKLQESFTTGRRNVIAYSGYRPFAGAGYYQGGWSFVVDTSKGAKDTSSSITSSDKRLSPQSFTLGSLYDAVERDVWALGLKNVLEIEGKLYVNGQYLPEKPYFFNANAMRPVTSVDANQIEEYKEQPTEDIRYYQCLRFNFWRGEMIFTAFLRFVRRGKDLFVEIDYLLLPPMQPDYHWADEKELVAPISKFWELYIRTFRAPIETWLGAPFRLLRSYSYTSQQRRLARIARNSPAFDYGATTSLRQAASDDEYHLFFQKLDEQMYLKIIEKQILETIVAFLKEHQIDTTDLVQREQAILNNNTNTFNGNNNFGTQNVSGGNVNLGNQGTSGTGSSQ